MAAKPPLKALPSDRADDEIAYIRQRNATYLDLSFKKLSKLPSLAGMDQLLEVRLIGTEIEDISQLSQLTSLRSLDLTDSKISNLTPISHLIALEWLKLDRSRVSDLSPLSKLLALKYLSLAKTKASNLKPLSKLTKLESLNLSETLVATVASLAAMVNLENLDLSMSTVNDLSGLSRLRALRSLDIHRTNVSDLTPLASLTQLIDAARIGERYGLFHAHCRLLDKSLLKFADLGNPLRTSKTINHLREQQGLPPYRPPSTRSNKGILPTDAPHSIDGVPSPFDFKISSREVIGIAESDTNLPVFTFPGGREDHERRLEACKMLARDLVQALSEERYHNVRLEYGSYLHRYLERLPADAGQGNMLLADGMARTLHHLFSAEVDVLPAGFAAELRTMLEQHIALSVYYPEIGTFNRDVREGTPSRAFPLPALEAVVKSIERYTPSTFEPPVSHAFLDVEHSLASPPLAPFEPTAPARDAIPPPSIPGGITDPKASREFATAGSVNRLWHAMEKAATVATVGGGLSLAAHEMAPHVGQILQWLVELMRTFP